MEKSIPIKTHKLGNGSHPVVDVDDDEELLMSHLQIYKKKL